MAEGSREYTVNEVSCSNKKVRINHTKSRSRLFIRSQDNAQRAGNSSGRATLIRVQTRGHADL